MCGQVYERCQAGMQGESGSGSGHDLERARELMREGTGWRGPGEGCGGV